MSQPLFDQLRERLLRAGIAPRHVRRYIAELRDHFDDLAREEMAAGAAPTLAQSRARSRLGSDDALADVMLARPGMRSISARYPWAVFGLGPIAMVVATLVAAIALEAVAIFLAGKLMHRSSPFVLAPPPEWAVWTIFAWNTLATYAAPLAIAVALCLVGLRQRMSATWIFTGIVIACVLGAFQVLNWRDLGHHGELSLGSGLFPPFPLKLVVGGLCRAVVTIAISAAIYWYAIRRRNPDSTRIDAAASLAAE
jgi:hypothetical protein